MTASVELPTGARFYVWGHHYEVTGQAVQDGEPAVWVQRTSNPTNGKPLAVPMLVSRVLKYGVVQREED